MSPKPKDFIRNANDSQFENKLDDKKNTLATGMNTLGSRPSLAPHGNKKIRIG
ncbi:hypothetical protein [Castellaniella sp. S9]|uniref:hypothetical protein n=1 Tax=Castellaniella sp. S9 TaxID=2993652 RepID=UPI0022B384EC|nr:hypothetical protein [Castellaniella sp. S9]